MRLFGAGPDKRIMCIFTEKTVETALERWYFPSKNLLFVKKYVARRTSVWMECRILFGCDPERMVAASCVARWR